MRRFQGICLDTLAVAWKELQVFFKDRGGLVVLFVLPLLMSTMMGSVYSPPRTKDGQNAAQPQLPVAVVNQDAGRFGAQLVTILQGIEALGIQELDDAAQADQQVADGKVVAAVIVPGDFSEKLDAYTPSTVRVIVDPAQEQYGSIITGIMNEVVTPVSIQGELQYGIRTLLDEASLPALADPQARRAVEAQSLGVVMTQVQAMQEQPLVIVQREVPAGVHSPLPANAFAIFVPGFTVMFAFFLMPGIAGELWKEKQGGSLRRLLAAPLWRGSIVGGKMLAYMLVVVLQVLLLFGVGNVVFGMPLGRSFGGLLLITLTLGLAATALGMMVGGLARSAKQADSIGLVLGFLLGGLGGCIQIGNKPLFRAAGPLGIVSQLTPHAHALEGYLRLMNEDAGVVQVLPQAAILVGMGIVFFVVAMWRFRFD